MGVRAWLSLLVVVLVGLVGCWSCSWGLGRGAWLLLLVVEELCRLLLEEMEALACLTLVVVGGQFRSLLVHLLEELVEWVFLTFLEVVEELCRSLVEEVEACQKEVLEGLQKEELAFHR